MRTQQPIHASRPLLIVLTIALLSTLLTVSNAFAQTDVRGKNPRTSLDQRTYTPVKVYKLKNARVVWKLRSSFKGLDDARIDQLLLDCCGYVRPSSNLTADAVDPENFIELDADKYGGPGMNGNYGSGRAASKNIPELGDDGEVQIKGMGQTDMINVIKRDQQHSSGFLYYEDALIEAAWSVIANAEAPWGANKVLAIIDTGAEFTSDGINWEPAVIIVREDPMRPAHFIYNTNIDPSQELRKRLDTERTEANLDRLASLLPASRLGPDRSLSAGLTEYATRLGEQYSYLFANRLHHGATTPSNIGLRGELLDLATQAALGGYQKSMAVDLLPFGDPDIAVDYILRQFWDAAETRLTAKDRKKLPDFASLKTVYMKSYRSNEAFEFLKLLGLDHADAQALRDQADSGRLVETLERLIDRLYPERQQTYLGTPTDAGPVSVSKALIDLASQPLASVSDMRQALKASGINNLFANELAVSAHAIFSKASMLAAKRGQNQAEFAAAVKAAAADRNETRTALFRVRESSELRKSIARKYRESRDVNVVQNFVDQLIQNNIRNPKDASSVLAPKADIKAKATEQPTVKFCKAVAI